MNEKKITAHIISEKKDVSKIVQQLNEVSVEYYHITPTQSADPDLFKNDIVIFYITSLHPPMLQHVVDSQKYQPNKMLLVVENKNPLITSRLAKLGFNDIYLLPEELFKFGQAIDEIVETVSVEDTKEPTAAPQERDLVFHSIIGESSESEKLVAAAVTAAENSSVNVLILGETGTGKGMLANAIHNYSNKKNSPFVEITCSAIPEHLLESELFGYEKGAFTDAKTRKYGLFELANNGTIFLDEIGELSPNLQAKLLRVLEKKIIRRVGGTRDIPVSARIISATHRNLSQLIEQNLFRADLFYRLNVIMIELTALRKRKEFILSLVNLFVKEFGESYNKEIKNISNETLTLLTNYNWPGNIRELRNVIERAVLLCKDNSLTIDHFENVPQVQMDEPAAPFNIKEPLTSYKQQSDDEITFSIRFNSTPLQQLSLYYAQEVLKKVDGNKSSAAKLLGISRPTLDKILSNK